jgi:hypothetical protein
MELKLLAASLSHSVAPTTSSDIRPIGRCEGKVTRVVRKLRRTVAH